MKKPEFFEIKDAIMIARIFDVAVRHKIKLTLWLKNQSLKFEAEFSQTYRESKTIAVGLPPDITYPIFEAAIKNQGSDDVLGSLQIDQTNFFYKTVCLEKNHTGLVRMQLPTSIYKMQRRVNLRIPFSRQLAPTLTLFDPAKKLDPNVAISPKDLLKFRMLDLSGGGCGIAAKIDDKQKLAVDTLIHDIRFIILGMEIVTDGVVKHVGETKNDVGKPMLKVGIQFQSLKMDYDKHIVKFVLDESRKIFTLLQ